MPGPTRDGLNTAVHALREVRLPAPHERVAAAAEFYSDVLELERWPADRQLPGGLGLGDPRQGVFLQFRHAPRDDAMRPRCTLLVRDLDEVVRRLEDRGAVYERLHGLCVSDDCILVLDPAGNRVVIRQTRAI